MKTLIQITLIFVAIILLSCKSTQHVPFSKAEVTKEDFIKVDDYNNQSVIVSQVVDRRIKYLPRMPWRSIGKNMNNGENGICWTTSVEDKMYMSGDDILDSSFAVIDYFNPKNAQRDLMVDLKMWIYEITPSGDIVQRELKKNEIKRERLNDSISRISLNIDKDILKGKMLLRKYTLLSPYYNIDRLYSIERQVDVAIIEPWLFQYSIPLLFGKYDIYIPKGELYTSKRLKNRIVVLGDGDINIVHNDESIDVDRIINSHNSYRGTEIRRGDKEVERITATVQNVMPLKAGSNEQPLGIKIERSPY